MSIRDIIETAATTAEAVKAGSDRGTEGADRRQAAWDAKQRFAATFNPKHVALMEAMCEAADDSDKFFQSVNRCRKNRKKHCGDCPEAAICRMVDTLHAACTALTAYRKERGL